MDINIKIEIDNFEAEFGAYHNGKWIPEYLELIDMLKSICQELFKDNYAFDFEIVYGHDELTTRKDTFIAEILVAKKDYDSCLDFFPKTILRYFFYNRVDGSDNFIEDIFKAAILRSFDSEAEITYNKTLEYSS